MKTSTTFAIALAVASTAALSACGMESSQNSLSGTSAASDTFYISRLGDTSKCLQAMPTSGGMIAVLGNCSGISPTRIRTMSGSPYTPGFGGYVTISADGQCLSNPKGQAGAEDGRLMFLPCNDDGTEYGTRQMFMLFVNGNGAVQVRSNLDLILGRSNPLPECMESPRPGQVQRQACVGMNNWQIWR